jgi:hypothetical protein
MTTPKGPLLAVLAERILSNLDTIESLAPKWGSPNQEDPPYSDTQLLISLLGVLVFPHERTPGALGALLKDYKPLDRVLHIVWSRHRENRIGITDTDGHTIIVDPNSIKDLPKLLRHSIAHFNVRTIDREGRFGGIRVWNRDENKELTFIADLNFDELRLLARHILCALRDQKINVRIDDPPDPMVEVKLGVKRDAVKAPRLNRDIWKALVKAHHGNAAEARTTMDRLLKKEADKRIASLKTQP